MAVSYMGSESNLILALVVASPAPESPHLFNTQLVYHHVSQSDGLAVLGNYIRFVVKDDYKDRNPLSTVNSS